MSYWKKKKQSEQTEYESELIKTVKVSYKKLMDGIYATIIIQINNSVGFG